MDFSVGMEYEDKEVIYSGSVITDGLKPFKLKISIGKAKYSLMIELREESPPEGRDLASFIQGDENNEPRIVIYNIYEGGGLTSPTKILADKNTDIFWQFSITRLPNESESLLIHHTWSMQKRGGLDE